MNKLSPKRVVKILRVLYPFWVAFGIFSIMYVPSTFLDMDDPVQTANNIYENTTLFRLGIAGSLITQILFIIIPFFLYQLFKKFDKVTSALMLVLALVSVPISMYIEVNKLIGIDLLDKPAALMERLDIYYYGLGISTIFWGLWLLPLGWLVYKSSLFPKLVGVALFIAGFGYLISSFINIVFPEFNMLNTLFDFMTFGEMVFIIWFVVKGVSFGRTEAVPRMEKVQDV